MGILREFKEFAVKGNALDLAIGIIIGAAFGKIVSSLVGDVLMPPIGMLIGNVDFSNLVLTLKEATPDTPAVTIRYGLFINTLIDFLVVAIAVFLVVKQINRFKRPASIPEPVTKECPYCKMSIPVSATRCGHCTSQLTPA